MLRVAEPLCPYKRAALDEKSKIQTNVVENATRAKETSQKEKTAESFFSILEDRTRFP